MQPFKLTLQIATPFALNHPMTLDGLLSAAIFRKTGLKEKDTIPEIPLAREKGIFKGSSIHYPRQYQNTTVPKVMKLAGVQDVDSEKFAPNGRKDYKHIDIARGPYKTNMDSYRAISAREVYFWGVGDADEVLYLIKTYIMGIGKRAAGEIVGAYIESSEDYSWKTESGTPARPLPKAVWDEIGDEQETAMLTVDVPYWSSDLVESVFPKDLAI